jgi:hypothetical protein
MNSSFKKEVEKNLTEICKVLGFKKKKYNFYKPLNTEVFATIGFGIAIHSKKGHVYVNVTIGVFYKNVEELKAKLTGYNNNLDFMQPTIGIQIGYLMKENSFKEWDFTENKDNSIVYNDLFKNIQNYGFEYHEKMKNIDNLLESIEKRVPGVLNHAREKYLPIIYYLKGNKIKGIEFIDKTINMYKSQPKEIPDIQFEGAKTILTITGKNFGKISPDYFDFRAKFQDLE